MKLPLSKVLRALRKDFVELSNCRCNGRSIVVESIKKRPCHVPETWNACFHIQLNNLTVATVEVFEQGQTVKVVLQRWVANYATDISKATGKAMVYRMSVDNVYGQLSKLTSTLAKHIRKQSELPEDCVRFPMRWSIVFAAKSIRAAKDALQEAMRDLDQNPEQCNMNGCEHYALTLRYCPPKRCRA